MQQYKKFWDNFNEELLDNVRYEKIKKEASFCEIKVNNEYDEQFVLLIMFVALIASMALLYESLLNL